MLRDDTEHLDIENIGEKEKLYNIENNMNNGNWTDAIETYKTLRITPREFQNHLEHIVFSGGGLEVAKDILMDWAILGYYAKENQ